MGSETNNLEQDSSADILSKLKQDKLETPENKRIIVPKKIRTEDRKKVITLLNSKKQIILYGPPGTSKTFKTKEYAVSLIRG